MDTLRRAPVKPHSVVIKTHPDQNSAIGLATSFVAAKAPFAAYRADQLVSVIVGQVQRQHYAFAVRDGRVVGYVGWALCASDTVEAWLSGGPAPRSEQCDSGTIVVPVIVAADDPMAIRKMANYVRTLYPGWRYLGRRIFTNRQPTRQGRIRPIPTIQTS